MEHHLKHFPFKSTVIYFKMRQHFGCPSSLIAETGVNLTSKHEVSWAYH